METLNGNAYSDPFPHLILENFYNEEELELVWEELKYYTKPGKLLEPKDFGGVVDKTNSHAIALDAVYINDRRNKVDYRKLSNILTVNRKLFLPEILEPFAKIHDCCSVAPMATYDVTKIRYYHDEEYYDAHIDKTFQFLAFSYFYKEPKKFEGGELYFPDYIDIDALTCENNMTIIFPGWVQHGVRTVTIKDSDYYDGFGRYAITSFMSCIDNEKRNFQGLNKKD